MTLIKLQKLIHQLRGYNTNCVYIHESEFRERAVTRFSILYRSASNAGLSSQEKNVCLSVCPSVKRVDCDKMEESSVEICIRTKDRLP